MFIEKTFIFFIWHLGAHRNHHLTNHLFAFYWCEHKKISLVVFTTILGKKMLQNLQATELALDKVNKGCSLIFHVIIGQA